MTEPSVSICIPTYQGSRWIRDSIASALAQDYPRVEVVVSDDQSTDGTAEAAEAVADERVRVVRSDRRLGMAGNWNRSVQLARGDYIKFLMQDDLLDPTCVSRMATVLTRHSSVGFVFAQRTIAVEDPADAGSVRLARKLQKLPARLGALREVNDGRAIFHAMRRTGFRGNWIGEPTAVMVRRDALRRVGLFNTRVRQLTDLEMWLRLAFFFDVGFVPAPLATFRLHRTSATSANAAAGTPGSTAPGCWRGCGPTRRSAPRSGLDGGEGLGGHPGGGGQATRDPRRPRPPRLRVAAPRVSSLPLTPDRLCCTGGSMPRIRQRRRVGPHDHRARRHV